MSVTTRDRIEALAMAAQDRGGRAGRRADGAFFTDADVADHLARRAIGAWLIERAGLLEGPDVDALLAAGADVLDLLVREVAGRSVAADRIAAALGEVRVLDPTCGAGSFLAAAWAVLHEVDERLGLEAACPGSLQGTDCSQDAIDACVATLDLVLAQRSPRCGHRGCRPTIALGDAELRGTLPEADVLLGNPPFVRSRAGEEHVDLSTAAVPNRAARVVERALSVARPGARATFVLPISTSCTDAFAPARRDWSARCSSILAGHFDSIPSSLFEGVVQRISIYEGRVRTRRDAAPCSWWTTRYHRWRREERAGLLAAIRHVPAPPAPAEQSLPKVGTQVELRLLERIAVHPPAGRFHAPGARPANQVHYKRRWSYFLLFTDFVPGIWDSAGRLRAPSELRTLAVVDELPARVLLAAYSSTLFWWYFSVFTDNRNVNVRDLAAFPLPRLDVDAVERLDALGAELSDSLRACSEVRTCTYRSVGTIRNTYFRQGATRPVLDRIDRELAAAYGMDHEELAFVLGYERRFRR